MYFPFCSGELIGVNGIYVDDLLCVGNDKFKSTESFTLERLETVGNDEVPVTFAGIRIEYYPDGTYTIDQLSYVDKSYATARSCNVQINFLI